MKARVVVVLLAGFVESAHAAGASPAAVQRRSQPAVSPAAAQMAVLAAEDGRIPLPDGLQAPAIEALRAKAAEDLRVLLELARSTDPPTQTLAIRALGRLERRDLIPDLLQFLAARPRGETANALAQSFRGAPLPNDTGGQQVQGVLEALIQVGEVDIGAALGAISRSIGRLPYATSDQVRAADAFLLSSMRRVDPDPSLRSVQSDITRALESLARTGSRLASLSDETIQWLRRTVTESRHKSPAPARVNAMAALMAARGVDEETLRAAAADTTLPGLRRLAAASLAGAGSPVVPAERTDLLATLLRDSSAMVRVEAVRAWARQETRTSGCVRLLEALKDPNSAVALAATDALGEQCRDDVNVTDRLTAEARTPPPNEWHRAAHALLALARRAPDRVVIPLQGSHVGHATWQVRMYAARAAAITNDVAALERLALDPNDNVREATLAALKRLKGDEAEPYFVAALGRSDYQLLRTAALELNGMKATPPLAVALGDALRRVTAGKKETSRDTRLALLERLRELGNPDQAGALAPLLQDFDIPVAMAAAALLQAWTGKPQEIAPQPLPRPALPQPVELEEARTTPGRIKLGSGRTIAFNLKPAVAPLASVRFLRLAKAGYYDGLTIQRVVPNFVVQGGSPGANEYAGDAQYMRDEISLPPHVAGTIGVSTRGRDTGDAQFFINLVDNPRLDFEYTAFGEVEDSDMPVLDTIAEGETIVSITFKKQTTEEKGAGLRDAGLEHPYGAGVGVGFHFDPLRQRPLGHPVPDHRP
jgi:cyclophilin family peptidyl-prolyl cis-trans isomerase/HEAT repeat protein